jgi:hypothetical protein
LTLKVDSHSVGNIVEGLEGRLMGRVVDENVDAAELIERGLDDLPTMRRRADVAGKQHGRASGFLHEALRLFCVVVLIEIGDDDVRAFARESDGDRAPDAAVRSGDDGLFAGQFAAPAIGILAVIGLRPHRLGMPRHRLTLTRKRRFRTFVHGAARGFGS